MVYLVLVRLRYIAILGNFRIADSRRPYLSRILNSTKHLNGQARTLSDLNDCLFLRTASGLAISFARSLFVWAEETCRQFFATYWKLAEGKWWSREGNWLVAAAVSDGKNS